MRQYNQVSYWTDFMRAPDPLTLRLWARLSQHSRRNIQPRVFAPSNVPVVPREASAEIPKSPPRGLAFAQAKQVGVLSSMYIRVWPMLR